MKWVGSFLLIFNMVFFFTGTVLAQTTSSKVHDLYYKSVAFPDEFDSSFELLEAWGLMKQEMISCLVPLKDKYFKLASVTIEQCEIAHPVDSKAKWRCLKKDPSASLAYWANDMIQVIEDDREWVNTYTGKNMLMGKHLAEQFQRSWVQMIKMGMPTIKQMISCP